MRKKECSDFPYIQSFLALRFFSLPFTPYPFFTLVNLVPFWDPGHINCQNLMKFGMVACINILQRENRSTAGCRHRRPAKNSASLISCFLRVSDHLELICKILFSPVTTADSPVGGAGVRPFLPLKNINTSYHSEF